jgi:hypothetical protein
MRAGNTKQSRRIRKTPARDLLFWLPLFALDPVTLLARYEAAASPELADRAGVAEQHEALLRPGGTS